MACSPGWAFDPADQQPLLHRSAYTSRGRHGAAGDPVDPGPLADPLDDADRFLHRFHDPAQHQRHGLDSPGLGQEDRGARRRKRGRQDRSGRDDHGPREGDRNHEAGGQADHRSLGHRWGWAGGSRRDGRGHSVLSGQLRASSRAAGGPVEGPIDLASDAGNDFHRACQRNRPGPPAGSGSALGIAAQRPDAG